MTAAEVLGLYRAMQKSAKRFTNYNVRECVRVVSRHRSSPIVCLVKKPI